MKRTRHTTEQIIRKLREVEKLQGSGTSIAEICKKIEVSEQTLHRWRKEYGGAAPDAIRELRELRKENARLKKAVADLTLDKQILKEVAEGNF